MPRDMLSARHMLPMMPYIAYAFFFSPQRAENIATRLIFRHYRYMPL